MNITDFNSKEIYEYRKKILSCESCIIIKLYLSLDHDKAMVSHALESSYKYFHASGCIPYCFEIFTCLNENFLSDNYSKINDYLTKFKDYTDRPFFHLPCSADAISKGKRSDGKGTCIDFFYFLYDLYKHHKDEKALQIE